MSDNKTELAVSIMLFWVLLTVISIYFSQQLVISEDGSVLSADLNDKSYISWQDGFSNYIKILSFQVKDIPILLSVFLWMYPIMTVYLIGLMLRGN